MQNTQKFNTQVHWRGKIKKIKLQRLWRWKPWLGGSPSSGVQEAMEALGRLCQGSCARAGHLLCPAAPWARSQPGWTHRPGSCSWEGNLCSLMGWNQYFGQSQCIEYLTACTQGQGQGENKNVLNSFTSWIGFFKEDLLRNKHCDLSCF